MGGGKLINPISAIMSNNDSSTENVQYSLFNVQYTYQHRCCTEEVLKNEEEKRKKEKIEIRKEIRVKVNYAGDRSNMKSS